MSRLVVVSNRVPASDAAAAGGLAVALRAALEETGGLWFGWSGEISDTASAVGAPSHGGPFATATIDLGAAQYEGYYENYANRTLWPLFHGRLDLASVDHEAHAVYREVNRRFADGLVPLLAPADTIWVHDYHLIPLAAELRRRGVTAPIGFFLHIPFPAREVIAALPWAGEMMDELAAYDLVGLQARRDLLNFRDAVSDMCAGRVDRDGCFSLNSFSSQVGVFPIGIDVDAFSALAASTPIERRVRWLERRLGSRTMIIGVDRLDYTKGIRERFEAYEKLLATSPGHRGNVTLLQIAAPSREGISEYQAMQSELETLVGHVNGEFGTVDWVPLRYIHRCYSHSQIAALYRFAQVALITPLCDGMNLVAKEYVAAQDPASPGVLILSRFTGAAEQMADALLVNPYDRAETARALSTAIAMPLNERRARWTKLMDGLQQQDVHEWRRSFLAALARAGDRSAGNAGPRVA